MDNRDPVFESDRYVFYTGTPDDKVDRFDPAANPEYRFLAALEPCTQGWRWTAIAIVEAEDQSEAAEVAGRITAPPDPVDETADPKGRGAKALRRTKHFKFFGFARIRVQGNMVDEVLEKIDDKTMGYSGSASVQGKFQILVELGGDTPDEVCERLTALASIAGVTGAESARVTGSQYFYRPPGKPGKKYRVGDVEED
jgi:hypothetical protein